jgi:hypothetical protein
VVALLAATSLCACGSSQSGGSGSAPFDDVAVGGKADQAQWTHIIDDIELNSTIDGKFSDRIRVYGFTVEAKAGATLSVEVTTKAGTTSGDVPAGTALDTVIAAYGPMEAQKKGPRIAYADDNEAGGGGAAQLPALKIAQDGKYIVVMSTWNDPGAGSYKIKVGCAGTDFQCRKPVTNAACTPGTRYVTGGTVIGTEEWKDCEIVLMETIEVAKDAVLTVRPGVTVKGNYIGTDAYGTVQLVVNGTLQSVGTSQNPVVFTALKNGWKGMVLNGDSNTLQHTFVEKAETGVTVQGSHNTLLNINVNSGITGLYFVKGSQDNKVARARLSQVRDGIHLAGSADISDSVFQGPGTDVSKVTGSGIWGDAGTPLSHVDRCLFTNFPAGMYLASTEIEVHDTTLVNNARGVFVTGANPGVHPAYTCPAVPQAATTPPQYHPPMPSTWGRDPIFIRCDVIKNIEYGIKITAPELLVIEECNVRDNGAGIVIESDSLNNDSRITKSNILRNGTGAQVDSYHVNGTLNISGNYWAQLSDPELSASWRMQHSQDVTCTGDSNGNPNCSNISGSQYQCGQWVCTWNSSARRMMGCTMTHTTTWNGQFIFTGFSPVALPAGPKFGPQSDLVTDQRQQLGL